MMDRGKMTLKEICQWIQERFAYFRTTDNWNVSIVITVSHINSILLFILLFISENHISATLALLISKSAFILHAPNTTFSYDNRISV